MGGLKNTVSYSNHLLFIALVVLKRFDSTPHPAPGTGLIGLANAP